MRDTKSEILNFWFVETEPQIWFQKPESFSNDIKERFLVTYDMAREGLCHDWSVDADGCLALCLLLDQMPRLLFSGTAKAYETDESALLIAKQALHRGFDQVLPHEQRFFIYLPFEHSENMADQQRNLELFEAMQNLNPLAYNTAKRHFETFKRFGRFPQRNDALGRDSTPEEQAWLEENRLKGY